MLDCSLILKMKVVYSSETSVNLYKTTRRYILHDTILHSDSCENIGFSNVYSCFLKAS
jgi:hypothetical protein